MPLSEMQDPTQQPPLGAQPPAPAEPLPGQAEPPKPPEQAAGAEPDPGTQATPEGAVQVLSTKAFKQLKLKAQERGVRAAQAEVERKVKAAGYGSLDDLIAKATQTPPAAQAAAAQQPAEPPRQDGRSADGRAQRELARLQSENAALTRKLHEANRRLRDLEADKDAAEAEVELVKSAVGTGITKDVDYAVSLLKRSLRGKTEDELQKFDEKAYFSGLRKTHPYLFGETAAPANTGPSGGPPAAGAPRNGAAPAAKSVRDMSRAEFLEYQRKLGYNPSATE